MADLLVIFPDNNLPARLHGSCPGITIRRLAKPEQLSIEDYFHEELDEEITLPENYATVTILDVSRDLGTVAEYVIVVEFALSMIVRSGHPLPLFSVLFDKGKCVAIERLHRFGPYSDPPTYLLKLRKAAVSQWMSTCITAYQRSRDRLHITMYRFIRYARSSNPGDRMMDLAISLESILESQTEVSFRFSVLLTKATNKRANEAIHNAALLADLYTLRSKLAHGDPTAVRLMKTMRPRIPELHQISREVLTNYIILGLQEVVWVN